MQVGSDFYFTCLPLYMFRALLAPIIRIYKTVYAAPGTSAHRATIFLRGRILICSTFLPFGIQMPKKSYILSMEAVRKPRILSILKYAQ